MPGLSCEGIVRITVHPLARSPKKKQTKKIESKSASTNNFTCSFTTFFFPMACQLCPKGSLPASYGDKHYTAKGKEVKLGDQCAYVVGDSKWKSAVIVCHDVFGPNKGTHHQLCDALAAGGHYVIMPDFFNGGSIEPYYASKQVPKGVEWLKEFDWKHCSTVLDAVHAHLKDEGIERTGSIGFCWGSWVVAKLTQDASKCQAGVWAHPSVFVGKDLYEGETEQELTAAVKAPTLVMPSKQEPDFYKNGELTKIAEANGVPWETIDFKDQMHGWVIRGSGWLGSYYENDTTDVRAIIGVQRAVNAALGFYAKHLPY